MAEKLKMKDDILFKVFFSRNQKNLKSFLGAILGKDIKIARVTHDARLEQLEPKEDYSELKKVIIIAILDFSITDLSEYLLETVRIIRGHDDYELNNEVKYYYIELDKFRKQNPDMSKILNQWLAFIDMERRDLLEMAMKENKEIEEAVEKYEVLTGEDEVKRLAELRLMSKLEENAALASARAKGTEEGLKQGKEEGLKQGKEEIKKIVRNLIKMNYTTEQIQEITGLSSDEIMKIKTEK